MYEACQYDTWDAISYKLFGNEYHTFEIMLLNPQYADVIVFEGGEVLKIPNITTEVETPWR